MMMWVGGIGTLEKKVQSIAFFQVSEVLFTGCSQTLEEKLYGRSDIVIHQTSLIGLDNLTSIGDFGICPWRRR